MRIITALLLCAAVLTVTAQQPVSAPSGTVTGVVTDESGEPLPGASIWLKETSIGVVCDIDGRYSIHIGSVKSPVLVASYVGYAAEEEVVGNRTVVNFQLKEQSAETEEVVVVGYGMQKKESVVGAITALKPAQLKLPVGQISNVLAGQLGGVISIQRTGEPGQSSQFWIRGVSTTVGASNKPLILVDGIERELDLVDVEDIETFSVLKDATATAVYGVRGANGVLLITTKKGKKGDAPKVTYSNIFASEQPITDVSFMYSMPEWMEIHNQSQRQNNPAVTAFWYAQETIDEWRAANANPNGTYTSPATGNSVPNWLAFPNTDWAQVMFIPEFFQKHTLSVTGGSASSNYLLSVGYQDNPGTLENTAQQRYNIRANAETRIADFIKFGTQTYATKYFKEPGSTDMTYLFQAYPGIYPKYEGKYGAGEDPSMVNMNNVLLSVAAQGGMNETTRIYSTWYAGADIFKGLYAEAKFNYQNTFGNNENYSQDLPRYRFRESTETPAENIGVLDQATTYRYSYLSSSYTADLTLNYNGKFGDHDVSALFGYEQYYTCTSSFTATKKGLIDWSITDITSAAEMYDIGGSAKTDYAMISWFGRLNYGYKGKYLFEGNFRSDASSRFAPGHRWGLFPSFSVGWRISEEDFFETAKDYVNNLKLRASWGKLGNTASGNYSWQALYSKRSNVLDQSVQNGLAQSQLPNTLLSWESVTTTDIGIDASFLHQRLNIEFDWYKRSTSGILTNPPVFYTMGNISAPMANTADMENNGVDFTVNWNDKVGDFRYGISLNASYNTNKVTNFKGALLWGEIEGSTGVDGNPVYGWVNLSDVSTGSDTRRVEGYMLDEWFLRSPYKGTGTYTNADGTVDPNGGPKDGMIRTKADLDWVNSMIAAGYSFNGKTVDNPNAARTQGGRGGYLWYGEMIMEDANGDGNYGNDNDRKFLGKSTAPKWTFGTTINGEWKGIDLSMTFAGRLGSWHYINSRGINNSNVDANTTAVPVNAAERFYSYDAVKALQDADYDPATDPTANINGVYPRLLAQNSSTNPSNTLFLYNTSFVKLKTMQIGYSLPSAWLRPAKIARLRIFFSGENLATFCSDKFLGVDPELGSSINVYPLARMLSGGISLTF